MDCFFRHFLLRLSVILPCLLLWISQGIPPASAQFRERDIIAQSNVMVQMRDGVNISLDIYRPAQPGRYPTLYAAGPYPHDSDDTPPDSPETGPVAWYVSQGFNYVLASVRGTGRSEGVYGFLSREEQQDHYEVIEWIAAQPWADGAVAGIGKGYYATAQWQMAVQNPPALSCIAPYNGVLRPYRDWAYPGGLANETFVDWYEESVRQANAFPASGDQRLVEYDLRLQQLRHPLYDGYWRERSSFEYLRSITIPVFMLRDWNPVEPGLDSMLAALGQLVSNNKLLIPLADNDSIYQDPAFLAEEVLPFYDWCLKDPELTRHIQKPRIRYYVRGENLTWPESAWPPGNVTYTPLYLQRQSGQNVLGAQAPDSIGGSGEYGPDANTGSLTFASAILEEDLIISGPSMLELFASSSTADTAFRVDIQEEVISQQANRSARLRALLQPEGLNETIIAQGTLIDVSHGILKASARAVDEESSTDYQPWYPFSNYLPLRPGVVTPFDIAVQNTSYRFRAGSRIVLTISRLDHPSLPSAGSDRVYHNSNYPSALWLPVVQRARRTESLVLAP